MIKIQFLFPGLLVLASLVCNHSNATGKRLPSPEVLSFLAANQVELTLHKNHDDIDFVGNHVDQLLNQGIPSTEILVIFDVDGTLTQFSDPHQNRTQGKFPARENAVQLVKGLKEKGVKLIASSAHYPFYQTLDKLCDVGLAAAFNMLEKECNKSNIENRIWHGRATSDDVIQINEPFDIEDTQGLKWQFKYSKHGNVISAGIPTYPRQKALTPKLAMSPDELEQVQHVLFVDDTPKTIQIFFEDIQKYKVFGSKLKKIDMIHLTWIAGYPKVMRPTSLN